jgi:hypothetical protein
MTTWQEKNKTKLGSQTYKQTLLVVMQQHVPITPHVTLE